MVFGAAIMLLCCENDIQLNELEYFLDFLQPKTNIKGFTKVRNGCFIEKKSKFDARTS